MDLSMYRLASWQELLDLREEDPARFDQYTDKVYQKLLSLEPGERFCLHGIKNDHSKMLFVKIACMAINEGYGFVFNNEFSIIKRDIFSPNELTKI